jgi:hypothetical protein
MLNTIGFLHIPVLPIDDSYFLTMSCYIIQTEEWSLGKRQMCNGHAVLHASEIPYTNHSYLGQSLFPFSYDSDSSATADSDM